MADLIILSILLVLIFLAVRVWRKNGGCKSCPRAAGCKASRQEDEK